MWRRKTTRRASARILGEYDGDGRTVPRLPVRILPVACSGQQLLLQRVWAGRQPLLAVRREHTAHRSGSVEGEKLCVQGLREKADKIKWVKKQKLIGATAHGIRLRAVCTDANTAMRAESQSGSVRNRCQYLRIIRFLMSRFGALESALEKFSHIRSILHRLSTAIASTSRRSGRSRAPSSYAAWQTCSATGFRTTG